MTAPGRVAAAQRVRVDPVACEGVGMCARVADASIALDRWGYPVVGAQVPEHELAAARRAVRSCPRQALWLEPVPEQRR
jgi:ferredoxin